MSQRPIFYFTRVLSAYRVSILEELNSRVKGRLVVCHGQPSGTSSTLMGRVDGDFESALLKNYWLGGESVHAQPFRHVFTEFGPPAVVLAEESPRSLTLPLLLRYARKRGAGRVLWGIFYSVFRPFSSYHPLQQYRLLLARQVEACACYTKGVKELLRPHVAAEKLFVAQNTLDTRQLLALHSKLQNEGKRAVRARLGLPVNEPIFVFTGQLIRRKGTRELLRLFQGFRDQQPATLLIIGDGPERMEMEQVVCANRISNVRFLGSIADFEVSAPYLFASDIMVVPGYVGLVVNHAFALGLPIVTQEAPGDIPFHGPEVESIVDGYNGVIAPREEGALLHAIQHVLDNKEAFSSNAASYVREHLTMKRMVDGLEAAVRYAEASAPAKSAD